MKGDVIPSDSMLGGNMYDLFSKIMREGDALYKGDLKVETRS